MDAIDYGLAADRHNFQLDLYAATAASSRRGRGFHSALGSHAARTGIVITKYK
jgi:hypothetical protein